MSFTTEDRESLLDGLVGLGIWGSKAEAIEQEGFFRRTMPVRRHLDALEPNILLIIGGRGAGKTHLFKAVNLPEGPNALGVEGRAKGGIWLRGFSIHSVLGEAPIFPDDIVIQKYAKGKDRVDLNYFWMGLLLGAALRSEGIPKDILRAHLPLELQNALQDLRRPELWFTYLVKNLEDSLAALDSLDHELATRDQFLFFTYDDLDVMALGWSEKRMLIQALLQFWLARWRRWARIRTKIFLRKDLFSSEFLAFPDASKLDGHRLDLVWNPIQLYQLVFKSWANGNRACYRFLEREGAIEFSQHPLLGWTYSVMPERDQLRQVVEAMVGKFMGAGPKKGRTFDWMPNHLQDANGEIAPRSMLNLFAFAANDERNHHRAYNTQRLLTPSSFAASIEEVSRRRISELQEEYPWLDAVKPVLENNHVPMPEDEMIDLLGQIDWSEVERPPPSTAPNRLMNNLLEIGILRNAARDRIHVPDIYLFGFGLKRKGGVKRPAFAR